MHIYFLTKTFKDSIPLGLVLDFEYSQMYHESAFSKSNAFALSVKSEN